MPGLLRGMARTAVVAGTATAVSNRVSRRQGERWAAQDAPPEPQQGYAAPPRRRPCSSAGGGPGGKAQGPRRPLGNRVC